MILTLGDSVSSVVGRKHDPPSLLSDDEDREWETSMVSSSGNVFPFQNQILKEEPRILGISYPLSGAHPAYPQPSIVGKEGGQFL